MRGEEKVRQEENGERGRGRREAEKKVEGENRTENDNQIPRSASPSQHSSEHRPAELKQQHETPNRPSPRKAQAPYLRASKANHRANKSDWVNQSLISPFGRSNRQLR